MEKAAIRATVFGHLSGIVLIPTIKALDEGGVLRLFHGAARVEFDQIARLTRANRGYLRVALRLLVACGWLTQELAQGASPSFTPTAEGEVALRIAPPLYDWAARVIPGALDMDALLFGPHGTEEFTLLEDYVLKARQRYLIPSAANQAEAMVYRQMHGHLEGLLVGPLMVTLARRGVLQRLENGGADAHSLGADPERLVVLLELLEGLGWLECSGDRFALTPEGSYAAQIATSYGVPVSYLPLLHRLGTLLFGDPKEPRLNAAGLEALVDREINIWGSGGAHRTYFKKVDEIVIDIFNRPISEQPVGICDMGCGDGTFLAHLYATVKENSLRGTMLEEHPLVLVGADFNQVARCASQRTLERAGIPVFHMIHGDISRPDKLARDLEKIGFDSRDFLHVRSFLDHNRPFLGGEGSFAVSRPARSTGAFAHLGDEVAPDVLEQNLVEHLRAWAPHGERFGLLILELHTLAPELTAANLDRTPALAYDGIHGYSDQYLVELPVFLDCASEAGLVADPKYQTAFPPSELATVSLNLFRGRN